MNRSVNVLGKTVRKIRKTKHLTQEALAEQVGVSKRTIIDIEKCEGNPKFDVLCKLVRALDLPLYQVFYPEVKAHSALKKQILREVDGCTEAELQVILAVVKSLCKSIKTDENDD